MGHSEAVAPSHAAKAAATESSSSPASADARPSGYAHAVAGAAAGLTAATLLHPLDTLRTQLQSSSQSSSSLLALLRQSLFGIDSSGRGAGVGAAVGAAGQGGGHWHVGGRGGVGPRTLYRGLGAAALGSVLSWACYFHSFDRVHAVSRGAIRDATLAHLSAGTVAGVITSVATNPIWVAKVRLQLHRGHDDAGATSRYPGLWRTLRSIAAEDGVRGLYVGLAPSLWLVSHGALQFTLYDSFKRHLLPPDAEHVPTATALLAATASKLVASVTTYPLQVVRTRMQEHGADPKRYGTFSRAFASVVRWHGIPGLYRGISANVLRVTPQAAVTFVTYERVLHWYRQVAT